MAKIYSLFISHSWTYGNPYDRLMHLVDNQPYFSFRDYSVSKDDPIHDAPNQQLLYKAIKGQILPCHAVIILSGVYATYSKWINYEIRIARNELFSRKPVLAVQPCGAEKTSKVVKENADLIVGWNTETIINGIHEFV